MVLVLAFMHLMLLVVFITAAVMGLTALAVVDGLVFLIMFGLWALILERKERPATALGRQAGRLGGARRVAEAVPPRA